MTRWTRAIGRRPRGVMMENRAEWTLSGAKARFSEVVERALSEGPQTVTRNGRDAVVVVSVKEWRRKSARKGNLAEFFAASPLKGSGINLERVDDVPREVDL